MSTLAGSRHARRGWLWVRLLVSVGLAAVNGWRAWAVPGESGWDVPGIVGGLSNSYITRHALTTRTGPRLSRWLRRNLNKASRRTRRADL